jgi:hypothetical protein
MVFSNFFILIFILYSKGFNCEIFFNEYNANKSFSSFSFSLSKDECFLYEKIGKSEKNEKSIKSVEFNKVIHYLNLGYFFTTGIFIFEQNDLFKYLNIIKEDDLSFSISDIYRIYYRIENKYNYNSTDTLLNEKGKKIYNEEKENFIEKCGNVLVENYNFGILFISSIKIKFFNKIEKAKYLEEYNKIPKNGNLKETYEIISSILNKNKIKSTIQILFIQIGGNTQILKDKMSKVNSKCTSISLDQCKEILLNLTENSIITEIQNQFNNNLNLLQTKFKIYMPLSSKSIQNFNISSNISEDIENSRKIIINFYKKFTYYNLHFENLVNHYPVYSQKIHLLYKNIQEIFSSFLKVNPEKCFLFISNDTCNNIINKIKELNEEKIESEIKENINNLKKYQLYSIIIKDHLCLNDILLWDEPHNLTIKVYPNDLNSSYVVKSTKFIVKNNISKSKDNLLLELNDGPFQFNFDIISNNLLAKIKCSEKNLNAEYKFHHTIQELDNPFYFTLYE